MDFQIGFLGFGEAASQFAKGFDKQGMKGNLAYDVTLNSGGERRRILDERLREAHVTPTDSVAELVEKARVIFLIIPAKFARDAALEALPFMTERQLFCDLTTNSPGVKAELGKLFEEKGLLYADASVMGAVPLYQHKTPTTVSGNGAGEMIRLLSPLGMVLTDAGPRAGRAVTLKLTRSIFVKGAEALTLETLMTARKLGIEKEIVEGIEQSFQKLGFTGFCGQLVTSGVLHAERRAQEARECEELEAGLGLNSAMMGAAFQKLKWYAEQGYATMEPLPACKTLDELYALWENTGLLTK